MLFEKVKYMKFESLRLHGFKSFVEPTSLIIKEGVTGIVGPNGCGKSNLLEALRWVMGESRAKSLRGDGMSDVIFAGTDKRPSRPFAEVVLSIDNTDGQLLGPFQNEKSLQISRRITRETGSTYRINGKEVRAKDIQLLFADASTGAHSPSLVRQGKINQLIHAKPKQRRIILEDAAGIGGLHSRRHEAETKLKESQNNLDRIEDILQNSEKQMDALRIQSLQAQKYKELSTNIRKTEILLLHLLYREASEKKNTIEEKLNILNTEIRTIETENITYFNREATLQEVVSPLKEELAIASAVLKKIEIEQATFQSEIKEAEQNHIRLKKSQENCSKDQDREQELMQDATQMIEQLKEEKACLPEIQKSESNDSQDAQKEIKQLEEDIKEDEIRYNILQKEINDIHLKKQLLTKQISEAEHQNNIQDTQLKKVTQELEQQKDLLNKHKEDETLKNLIDDTVNDLKQKEFLHNELANNLDALETHKASLEKQNNQELQDIQKLRAELNGLKSLARNKKVVGNQDILQNLTITAGYEKALGVALGDDLSFDNNSEKGRYWANLPESNPIFPDDIQPLMEHITGVPDFLKKALSFIGIIKDETLALHYHSSLKDGITLVSLSGKLWRYDGFVIQSHHVTQTEIILEQKNKIKSLEETILEKERIHQHTKEKCDEIKKAYQEVAIKNKSLQNDMQILQKKIHQLEKDQIEQLNKYQILNNKIMTLEEKRDAYSCEEKKYYALIIENRKNLEALEAQDLQEKKLENIKNEISQKRQEISNKKVAIEMQHNKQQEIIEKRNKNEKELAGWQNRFVKAEKKYLDATQRLEHIKKKLHEAEKKPAILYEKEKELSEKYNMAEDRYNKATQKYDDTQGELSVLTEKVRNTQKKISDLNEKKARLESSLDNMIQKTDDLFSQIDEKKKNTPDALQHELDFVIDDSVPPIDRLQDSLKDYQKKRDDLGAVNLLAQKELEQVEAEMNTLIKQKNDLIEAINKLTKAIKDINGQGRTKILEAFNKVQHYFKILFSHLFVGGTSELVLVESDDPLDAGLEIHACPPGKRTQSLSLLSGGEQALTCMALIFAVFLTNPSPICVLDEVDAPLDDANVMRYCKLIHEMTQLTTTRFLLITHHALTMAHADRLFGVTMAEKGVSQMVSVDLKEAEKMVA